MAIILAMPRRPAFEIIFDVRALDHMEAIETKYHSLIRRTVERQLTFEPDTPTPDRKPLLRETAGGAAWEVRCGPDNRFRIFYDVHQDQRVVVILAIARKVRDRLFVGKERFEP
jgi:mRNA-degrading endonuclease RelE of RelBE toxin-antitoxin system